MPLLPPYPTLPSRISRPSASANVKAAAEKGATAYMGAVSRWSEVAQNTPPLWGSGKCIMVQIRQPETAKEGEMFNWPKSKGNQENNDYALMKSAAVAAIQESGTEVAGEHPRFAQVVKAAASIEVGRFDSFGDIYARALAAAKDALK